LIKEKSSSKHNSIKKYIYSSELPFGPKEVEAESVIKILHALKILKSGGLALYQWNNDINQSKYAYENFELFLAEKVKKNQKISIYIETIAGLQGDIRSHKG
jgi:hypothetical protein